MRNIAMLAASVVCVAMLSAHGAYTITASRDYVDKKVYTLQTNLEERIENAQPGNYSVVSNKAMNAVQTETDPTVPQWAKAPAKPTYTASEVGAYSTNDTMYVDYIGDVGCIYGDYIPYGVWDFGNGCIRIANWYQLNLHMPDGRQADGIEIFDTADPTIKTVIPINGSDVATIADIPDVPTSVSNTVPAWAMAETKPTYTAAEVGAASTNDLVSATNSLDIVLRREIASAQPADYATVSNRAMTALQSYTETDPVWTAEKSGYVPTSRTVAGKALSSDVTLSASDVGALPTTGGTMTGDITFSGGVEIVRASGGLSIRNLNESKTWSFFDNGALTVAKLGDVDDAVSVNTPTAVSNIVTEAFVENLGFLPLDYFQNGQTIPMYWGDGTKLCDFGANWIGNLAMDVQNNSDAIDGVSDSIPQAVSNIVTTALVRERLGVYLYVGEDGGVYVHTPTNEEEEQ